MSLGSLSRICISLAGCKVALGSASVVAAVPGFSSSEHKPRKEESTFQHSKQNVGDSLWLDEPQFGYQIPQSTGWQGVTHNWATEQQNQSLDRSKPIIITSGGSDRRTIQIENSEPRRKADGEVDAWKASRRYHYTWFSSLHESKLPKGRGISLLIHPSRTMGSLWCCKSIYKMTIQMSVLTFYGS